MIPHSDRQKRQRQFILRALTDPQFRLQLRVNPALALGKPPGQITPRNLQELQRVLLAVQQIEFQIHNIADELLCANGGPCGIA